MLSSWQLLLPLLVPFSLYENGRFVAGGRIPSRELNSIEQRDSNSESISIAVPGLQSLSRYVCPNDANSVKRQDTTLPTITVPRDQLRDILLQIRLLELQFVDLIDSLLSGNDTNSTTASTTVAPSTTISSIPLESLSSAVESALCSANTSTTTIRMTVTRTKPIVTVTTIVSGFTTLTVDASSTTTLTTAAETRSSAAPSSTTISSRVTSGGGVFMETSTGSSPQSTAGSGPSGQPVTGYTFNAQSSKNVAVYFGQTPVTGGSTLEKQCADPNIDIVILAFVISATDGGQYPKVNFGAACGGQTPKMAAQAPGLLTCPELAGYIQACQNTYGKKVLLSIGGATSQISFPSATEASAFADVLWKLFGPAGGVDVALRPFGEVSVDGFDVDNENNMPANYEALASTLRSHYASASKTYYLSSAPQCPFPDASNPSGLLLLCDFVFVQFYNNPQCQIGSTGFTASIKTWSDSLQASTLAIKQRLYIGAPAFSEAGPSAYANIGTAEGMKGIASQVVGLGLPNLGGIMFWDGPEGMLNVGGGKDIIGWAKEGLQ